MSRREDGWGLSPTTAVEPQFGRTAVRSAEPLLVGGFRTTALRSRSEMTERTQMLPQTPTTPSLTDETHLMVKVTVPQNCEQQQGDRLHNMRVEAVYCDEYGAIREFCVCNVCGHGASRRQVFPARLPRWAKVVV